MKRIFLLGLLFLLVPFQMQASVDDNADGKDVAIVVLACGSAFMSGVALLWWWYTRSVKQELQYNLAHAQGDLRRTEQQLQATEEQLRQFVQAVGPVAGEVQRTNRAVGDVRNRVLAVQQAALVQLQRAATTTNLEEIWITMQHGGPPPAYDGMQAPPVQLLPPSLPPGVVETELRLGSPHHHGASFGEEA